MFEIEKGIAIPERKHGGRKPKYPFDRLEPGESFFVPGRKTMGSTIQSAMKKLGVKLVQATATKDGVAGVRVWRLPDVEPAREDTDPEPQQNEIPGKRGLRK